MKKILAIFGAAAIVSGLFVSQAFAQIPTQEEINKKIQEGMQQNGQQQGFGEEDNGQQGVEMEKRGQEMRQKGFKRLQRGAKNMQKPIDKMEQAIAGAAQVGYTPSAEVTEALNKAKAALALINSATDLTEEVEAAMDDFNDFIDVFDANIQNLEMAKNFPRIQKQADREVGNLVKAFEKSKAKLEKAGMDLTQQFADVQAKIDAIKATLAEAVVAVKEGRGEDAFAVLEGDFFPQIGEIRQAVGMLDALKNISRSLKSVEKGIKMGEKTVAKLAKKGFETGALEKIINQSKAKLEEFKAVLKSPDFDPTDAVDFFDSLNDLREQFDEAVDEVVGDDNVGNIQSLNFFNAKVTKEPKELNMDYGKDKGEFGKMDIGF